jgi:dTDP-4-dehydrorhamnose reductase
LKILVVGRTGQLARALVELSGADVAAAGRPAVDITHGASLEACLQRQTPDVVVNAAGYTAVDKAESEPEATHAINATGAERLAKACADYGVPLIHISTDYVFDGSASRPYREDDDVGPLGAYGASKLEGEIAVASFCPQHIILRTAWVHSPWGSNFVRTMLRLAETRREIGVVDDQVGCPTYAPHLAAAILTVAQQVTVKDRATSWGIYHIAGAGKTTWCGFARELFRHAEQQGLPSATVNPITTAEYPTPALRPANSQLDCGKFLQRFQFGLPDWRDGVASCVARLAAQKSSA